MYHARNYVDFIYDYAGIAVAMVGQIAFVGLMAPIVRYLVGTDYARVIPIYGSCWYLLLLVGYVSTHVR